MGDPPTDLPFSHPEDAPPTVGTAAAEAAAQTPEPAEGDEDVPAEAAQVQFEDPGPLAGPADEPAATGKESRPRRSKGRGGRNRRGGRSNRSGGGGR